MGSVSRRQIGFISGDVKTTTVKCVVASFSNANDIVVTAYTNESRTGSPAATLTVTAGSLTKYCDDRGANDPAGGTHVFYVGSGSLTSLTAGTRYYLKLVQDAVTETDASTCTAPNAGTDFNLFVVSCDLGYRLFTFPAAERCQPGAWASVKRMVQASALPSYGVWTDDLGYADMRQASVAIDGTVTDATTGKEQTDKPSTSLLAYDYGCVYAAMLGMLEDTTQRTIEWGRDEYRNWAIRNIPWSPQWGDHETVNDVGWGATASQADPTYAPGKEAFDTLWGLLRPTTSPDVRVADAGTLLWAQTLGDLRIVSPDGVTNCSGGSKASYPWSYATILGTNQITDILNAISTTEPFKLLAFGNVGEHPWASDYSVVTGSNWDAYNSQGAFPLMQPTEYTQLFHAAAASPLSLMDNPKTNGATGVLVITHGDLHEPQVIRRYGYDGETGTSGTGIRGDWVSYYIAPMNQRSRNMATDARTQVEGKFHRGMDMLKFASVYTSTFANPVYVPAFGHFLIEGSKSPKQMTGSLIRAVVGNESQYTVAYSGTFKVGSNRPRGQMLADRGMTYDIY